MARRIAIALDVTSDHQEFRKLADEAGKAEDSLGKLGTAAKRAGDDVDTASDAARRSGRDYGDMATKAGAAAGALLLATTKLAQAHVSEERQISTLDRAYGDQANVLTDLAAKYQDLGIATDDSVRIAAIAGQSLARNYGLATDEIAKLVEVSADLNATSFDMYGNQLGLTDVMQRVAGAIRGEGEAAEALGLNMSDSAVAAEAAARGFTTYATSATEAEKAQFRYTLVLEQASAAQGAAAEQAAGLAGRLSSMKMEIVDSASAFGGLLGPGAAAAAVLSDVALAAPLVGAALGPIAASLGGGAGVAAGLTAAGAAAAPFLITMGALAAPIGIATYLISDQDNVMRRAAEATAENNAQLQEYIGWLNQVAAPDVDPAEFQGTEADRLLDFFRGVNQEVLLTRDGISGVTVPMANLRDEVNNLDPANFQILLNVAEDFGIVWNDPSTWTTDNLNILAANVVHLTRTEQDAALAAMNNHQARSQMVATLDVQTAAIDRLNRAEAAQVYDTPAAYDAQIEQRDRMIAKLEEENRAEQENRRAVEIAERGKQAARQDSAESLESHRDADLAAAGAAQHTIAAEVAARSNATRIFLAEQNARGEAIKAATAAAEAEAAATIAAYESITGRDAALDALAGGDVTVELGVDASAATAALENVFRIGVGNLATIESTVGSVVDWATELVGVEGTLGAIDTLLANGEIDAAQHGAMQRNYNRMLEDQASIQAEIANIQADQLPYMELATDRTRDALDLIGDMEGSAQAAALGFMDAGESARFLEIQTALAAAAATEMGSGNRAAMQAMIEGIVATDPYMTAMLEQMGLIAIGADGTVTINFDGAGESEFAMLIESVDALTLALGGVPPLRLEVDGSAVETYEPPTFDPIEFPINLKIGGGEGDASAVDQLLAFGGVEPDPIVVPIGADAAQAQADVEAWVATTEAMKPTVEVDGGTGRATTALGQFLLDVGAATPVLAIDGDAAGAAGAADGAVGYVSGLDGIIDIGADTSGYYSNIPATGQTIGTNYIDVVTRRSYVSTGSGDIGFLQEMTGGYVSARDIDTAASGRHTSGRLTLVGETGPEFLTLPFGSTITNAAATRSQRGDGDGGGRGDIHLHGPVYITAATPDIHDALNGQILAQGRR